MLSIHSFPFVRPFILMPEQRQFENIISDFLTGSLPRLTSTCPLPHTLLVAIPVFNSEFAIAQPMIAPCSEFHVSLRMCSSTPRSTTP